MGNPCFGFVFKGEPLLWLCFWRGTPVFALFLKGNPCFGFVFLRETPIFAVFVKRKLFCRNSEPKDSKYARKLTWGTSSLSEKYGFCRFLRFLLSTWDSGWQENVFSAPPLGHQFLLCLSSFACLRVGTCMCPPLHDTETIKVRWNGCSVFKGKPPFLLCF